MIATERTAAGESWRGISVIAYHWEEPSGFSPPSSTMVDKVAFHWSTGPKDAEPLVRLKDVVPIVDGWRCFHCGDVFTDRAAAQQHFGGELDSVPACKIKGSEGGLVKAIRDAQLECARLLQQLHDEGGEVMQAYHSMSRRFSETARSCEETGFQRGVDQCFDPIREALAKVAATDAECPFKRWPRPDSGVDCPKCNATARQGCVPAHNAAHGFVDTVRELIEGKAK